ncbi:hypothetical protein Syun_020779 [Stephania yunnanensis]|uniref:Protein kinase domain-containing protein n=1 Tax=Stephania yunnanensis TaxID=152371 RepID=A0AAP0IEU7_9MAGN
MTRSAFHHSSPSPNSPLIDLVAVLVLVLLLLLCNAPSHGGASTELTEEEDDFRCLKGLKTSLSDPDSKLSSWTFANTSIGFICRFVGVSCWNERENRLIGLQLPSMKLRGKIPESLHYCQSLQSLDLSSNNISGSIPPQICTWLPYLVNLDLSGNDLSGPIPAELVNCKYLNTLILKDNRLSGSIPYQLSGLNRLKEVSVANNDLSGRIPDFFAGFDTVDFSGNERLCGQPLGSKCEGLSKRNLIIIVTAGVVGAVISLLLVFALWWWCAVRLGCLRRKKKGDCGIGREEEKSWVERLRALRLVQVTLFQKPLVKVKLGDLMAAANDFRQDNVIVSTRIGTSYKAVLPDGSALSIKRLHTCRVSEKQFRSEMFKIGQLRHPNVVPLLGFCAVEDEKLLVYKHMPNGSLFSMLHGNNGKMGDHCGRLDWPTRLKIGIGAAKGLAWLHNSCQPPCLHQSISSSVILLNEDLDARIADVEMARLMSSSESQERTFVNGDFGELGYVAPEYSSTMIASMKGDVYGCGVVLLELATGQKPLEVKNAEEGFKGNLVDWVNQFSVSGRIKDVIDKSICGKGHDCEILQLLRVACACVVSRPKDRSSMFEVYQSLKNIGQGRDFSEQFDEFPIIVQKQEH